MTVLEKLERYVDLRRKHDEICEALAHMETTLFHVRPQRLSDTPGGSGNTHAIESALIRFGELQEHYSTSLDKTAQQLLEVERMLDTLNPKLYRVLHLRYIQGLTIVDTAEQMGYSERRISQLQEIAIQQLEEQNANANVNDFKKP